MVVADMNLDALSDVQLMELRRRLDEAVAARDGFEPAPERSQACRLFTISEGVRRLDTAQLECLAQAFDCWVEASRDARTRRSRERVCIVFLVLRYAGARLGEVLALDENRDIDFEACLVRFGNGEGHETAREVPLPEEVVARIQHWRLRNDNGEGLFRLDQGFVRRKFHEQQRQSGLPRELLNPRCLRSSRATELLQGGMPLRAVQAMLGYARSDFVASHVALAENDLRNIVQQYCRKEYGMETSARNTFEGRVVAVTCSPVLCEVVLRTDSGYEIAAVVTRQSCEKLELEEGRRATALVKATWVVLEKGQTPPETSARNAFPGVVHGLVTDGVSADVQGELDDGTPVCALITAGSLENLGIGEGDPFVFMFTSMSVIIS